jgi:hypothetical protein
MAPLRRPVRGPSRGPFRRRVRLGGRFAPALAALRLPVLAALVCGGAVLVAARSGAASHDAAADPSGARLISVTLDPKDWPPGQPPSFRRVLGYYGLESTLLSATLAANMRGDVCPSPNAPIPVGATVLVALSHDGPTPCDAAAAEPG